MKKTEKTKKPETAEPELIISSPMRASLISEYALDTLLIHADDQEGPRDLAPPIHVSTTFKYDEDGQGTTYLYSRYDQPTRHRLEKVLGALDGGEAIVYSSGSAATYAVLMYYRPKRVFIDKGYAGTHSILSTFFSPNDKEWFHKILTLSPTIEPEKGDLLWIESPKNPTILLHDIPHYVSLAATSGATVVVDGTFATPVIQRPLTLGVDVVVHSCTKFISGQSDVLAGVIVARESRVAAGFKSQRTVMGSNLGNLENFLLLRSLRTLGVRVRRQSKTACAVAEFLEGHKRVTKVWHPSLKSHPDYELCKSQLQYPPPILSFELENQKMALHILRKFKLIATATSLGGVHSTIDWRYKFDSTVEPNLLRLSIGLESKKDLIQDLAQALDTLPPLEPPIVKEDNKKKKKKRQKVNC